MAARPEELPGADRRAARDARAALARRAHAAASSRRSREQTERHDGGDRWIGTGGHSPFGHGGEHPTGIRVGGPGEEPLGDEGRRGAPLPRLPHRRARSTCARCDVALRAPAPAHARRAGQTSSTSTRRSTRRAATPARSSSCSGPPRRNNVRLLLLMDVGGSMDPYFEPVSRLLTALHEERGPARLPRLLLPQLRLRRASTRDARLLRARRDPDRRPAPPARRALEGGDRRRRRDAPGRAAGGVRQHRPAPRQRRRPASTGCSASRDHFERVVWLNPEPAARVGALRRPTRLVGAHLPDVPPERGRHRRRRERAGRRARLALSSDPTRRFRCPSIPRPSA